ncbi:hypothetical protein D3C87_377240 [compost metagenome]
MLILFSLLVSFSAHAGKIISVKQNRALIDMESDSYAPGDRLFAVDNQGKRRAIIEIKQVKNGRAIGQVIKGRASANFIVMSGSAGSSSSSGKSAKKGIGPKAWGFTAGYAQNTMSAKSTASTTVNMTGSSFAVKAFYQKTLDGSISVQASTGYESLAVKGNATSGSCTSCEVNIGYLGFDALIRYAFYEKSYRVWAGGGLGFLLALSKSSNIIDTGKISTNQTILGAFGVDIPLSGGKFIPIELNYALYPSNNTTSANQIILRAGYGFSF